MGGVIKRTAIAVAICFCVPTFGMAQDVALSTKDGVLKVKGKLLAFDGNFYRVETASGTETVDANTVVCSGDGCPSVPVSAPSLTIVGDPHLAQSLMEAYAIHQSGSVEVSAGNVGKPVNVRVLTPEGDLHANVTVLQTAPAATSEVATLSLSSAQPPEGSNSRVIGLDALVVATSDVNPVDAISLEQMHGVLAGAITNWKELGGGDVAINLHLATGDDGFEQRILAESLKPSPGVSVLPHARMKDLSDAVANDPYGIAMVPFSQLRTARAMGLRGSCGMQNAAQEFTLKAGSYPMTYPIFAAYSEKQTSPFASEFIEFLSTETAQAVLTDFGYADMSIGTRDLDEQGQRLANSLLIIGREVPLKDVREMATVMSGAKRLSATFRFKAGSKRLDAHSLGHVNALAAGLLLGNYADKTVYLMGFSDGDGRAQVNKNLSKKRADSVLAALNKAVTDGDLGDVSFETLGYGEASPLVCEDTANDKHINRRVEVWVKDANTRDSQSSE